MSTSARFFRHFSPLCTSASLALIACGESASFTLSEERDASLAQPSEIFQSSSQLENSSTSGDDALAAKTSAEGRRELGQQASEAAAKMPASFFERSYSLRGKSEKVTTTVELPDGSMSQTIAMTYTEQNQSKTFEQIDRPLLTRTFSQGTAGLPIVESFAQSEIKGVLDVLVVVDNSGSMSEEQNNLSTKLSVLLSEISEANWKIGVVTTDPHDGCMRGLFEKSQPNASELFRDAVTAGTQGSGNELGIRQAVAGLSCPKANWLRPDSSIAVLIVSDEDNCSSNGSGCVDEAYSQTSYLTNHLSVALGRKVGVDARVYGLIAHPSDTTCKTAANKARQYASVIAETNGSWGSICAEDYTATLSQISRDMKSILKNQFALKHLPKPGTLNIKITSASGTELSAPYSLNGQVISFATPPPAGSRIQVNYQTQDEVQLTEFPLGAVAAEGTDRLSLFKGDRLLGGAEYMIVADKLVFKRAPAPGSRINVSFRQAIPLANEFMLGANVDPNSVEVMVNNAKRTDVEFLPASGVLKLKTPAADGAKINVAYRTKVPNLSYPLAQSIEPGSLVTFGVLGSGALTPGNAVATIVSGVSIVGSSVTITEPALFQAGSAIIVTSKPLKTEARPIPLAPGFIPGSLTVKSSLETCKLGKEILIVGNALNVNCPADKALKLDVEYLSLGQPVRSFAVLEATPTTAGTWKAFLDGRELLPGEFTFSDQTFTLLPQVEANQDSVMTLKLIPSES